MSLSIFCHLLGKDTGSPRKPTETLVCVCKWGSKETAETASKGSGSIRSRVTVCIVVKKKEIARGIRKSPEQREQDTNWTWPGLSDVTEEVAVVEKSGWL